MNLSQLLNFCPNCQKKLIKKENLFFCSACPFYLYQNPIPTNGLIIYNQKKEVLLVKRKFPPKKNFWDVAGGFVNLCENLEQSLVREVKEELNISIDEKKIRYLTSVSDLYLYQKIRNKTLCSLFVYQLNDNFLKKLKPTDDVAEARWFSRESLPWKKIAFAGVKKGLELFFSSVKNPEKTKKSIADR
ncbi:MAG: NUDIX domain-containing protein [Patescibacteria group bacterium]|nr:NUDIX domain-containing protein [Patescibacteria group bacterium]